MHKINSIDTELREYMILIQWTALILWKISLRMTQLNLRVIKNIPLEFMDEALRLSIHSGFGDPLLKFGSVKLFADGALGPKTAAMLETL